MQLRSYFSWNIITIFMILDLKAPSLKNEYKNP